MEKELTMQIPKGFIEAVNRRHNGDQSRTHSERAKAFYLMEKFYTRYKEYVEKENTLLNIEWEEKEIGKHFRERIWYDAHTKLKRYRDIIKETHKRMFVLLVTFDGNKEKFAEHWCIGAEEIYLDFKDKYTKQDFEE